MAFEILPCTLDDLPDVARVLIEAHRADPIVTHILPQDKVSPAVELSFWTACQVAEFSKPGRHFFKLVDGSSGQVVGMLNMHAPYTLSQEQIDDSGAFADDVPLPPGANEGIAEEFFGKMAIHEEKNLDHNSMYFINILAILPSYQRRGLGGLLLHKVMAMADTAGAKIYLESTGAGKLVYLKYGWVEFEYFEVDTLPYGGKGMERLTCMMRAPLAGVKN